MIYAAGVIQAGYAIVYEADAKVIHSHNLSPMEQFHRNFDLAVSQADHPEIFAGLPSEGEGIRLVKKTAGWLCKTGKPWLVPSLVLHSGMKYLGYRMGKMYQKLPKGLVMKCTMNRAYWERKEQLERVGGQSQSAQKQADQSQHKQTMAGQGQVEQKGGDAS